MQSSVFFAPDKVGERLQSVRESLGITQRDFSKRLGIDYKTYSKYENGDVYPKADVLARVAALGEISVDYLLGRTNDSKQLYTQIDELGLTEKSAEQLKLLNELPDTYLIKSLNLILEHDDLRLLLSFIGSAIDSLAKEYAETHDNRANNFEDNEATSNTAQLAISLLANRGYAVFTPDMAAVLSIQYAADVFKDILESCVSLPLREGFHDEKLATIVTKFAPRWRDYNDGND